MEGKIQTININNEKIPVIFTNSQAMKSQMIGVQGLVQIKKGKTDERTLRQILIDNKENILDVYSQMTKKAVLDRSYEEYIGICQKYIDRYVDELEVSPTKIRQTPMLIDHFGIAYWDTSSITFNSYMQYMNEALIENTVYHELCHIYTWEKYHTMNHDSDFYNILYKKYTKEENEEIFMMILL